MFIFRLFYESVVMAFQTFRGNRLRSALTLLGITIGIFAIISVFTAVDSLENNIRESVSAPGDAEEYAWWKYLNRPLVTIEETTF